MTPHDLTISKSEPQKSIYKNIFVHAHARRKEKNTVPLRVFELQFLKCWLTDSLASIIRIRLHWKVNVWKRFGSAVEESLSLRNNLIFRNQKPSVPDLLCDTSGVGIAWWFFLLLWKRQNEQLAWGSRKKNNCLKIYFVRKCDKRTDTSKLCFCNDKATSRTSGKSWLIEVATFMTRFPWNVALLFCLNFSLQTL